MRISKNSNYTRLLCQDRYHGPSHETEDTGKQNAQSDANVAVDGDEEKLWLQRNLVQEPTSDVRWTGVKNCDII